MKKLIEKQVKLSGLFLNIKRKGNRTRIANSTDYEFTENIIFENIPCLTRQKTEYRETDRETQRVTVHIFRIPYDLDGVKIEADINKEDFVEFENIKYRIIRQERHSRPWMSELTTEKYDI